jgi:hypothetical protein
MLRLYIARKHDTVMAPFDANLEGRSYSHQMRLVVMFSLEEVSVNFGILMHLHFLYDISQVRLTEGKGK